MTFFPIALSGWLAGALVNYLADVLPAKRRITAPFCLACQSPVPWGNYLLWPRRCPFCGRRRTLRTWAVELIFILVALWLWQSPPERLGFIAGLALLAYFGVVMVVDLEYRLILHPVSLAGAALGLIVGIPTNGLKNTLLGGVIGFASMLFLYLLGEWLLRLVARLRRRSVDDVALGFGDVNLSGVLGLMLGWPRIGMGLLLAVLVGGGVSLVYLVVMLIARRYRLFMALPYGPFLIIGAVMVLFFGGVVTAWLR